MAKKISVAVLGLGQFGRAIVEELVNNGMDVIAIDTDEDAVRRIAPLLPTAFIADSTNEDALKELGIDEVDVAIVAFGGNQEGSVLTTILLKELGVKRIVVRVDNEHYARVMLKLGASEVIAPQKMAGESLANRIWNDDYKDFYKLDEKYSIVSIKVDENYPGMTIMAMNPNFKYGVSIVLIVRNGHSFVPSGRDSILANDDIFCVGTTKDIQRFGVDINEAGNKLKAKEDRKAAKKAKKAKDKEEE
ncbi:MAG: TrkA family potassium uptake protein [Bacilli bacterium]|nr:TrkA family potassium uptake protein [Bacilli bacterium]